jgi:hypothetical protein
MKLPTIFTSIIVIQQKKRTEVRLQWGFCGKELGKKFVN